MTALPTAVTKDNFDNSAVDDPKQAFAELSANVDKLVLQRDYLLGLFGSSGDKVLTRAEFGLKALAILDQVDTAQIVDKSITAAKIANGTPGTLWSFSKTTGDLVEIGTGTPDQVLISNGPDELPTWGDSGGVVLQRDYHASNAVHSISAVIPRDDTVPNRGEGTQILNRSITPASTSSRILVSVDIPVIAGNTTATNDVGILTVFRGGTCIGVATTVFAESGDPAIASLSLTLDDAPNSISQQHYYVEFGVTAGTMYLNGDKTGARLFGGAAKVTLKLLEFSS